TKSAVARQRAMLREGIGCCAVVTKSGKPKCAEPLKSLPNVLPALGKRPWTRQAAGRGRRRHEAPHLCVSVSTARSARSSRDLGAVCGRPVDRGSVLVLARPIMTICRAVRVSRIPRILFASAWCVGSPNHATPPPSFLLRRAPAVVADELGQRLAPARRSHRARVLRGSRAPDHHDLARMPILWDAEDPFRLRLERRLPEPGDATAVAEQLRSGEQALGHATLVIGLAESAPGREHDRDAERRAGRPVDARAQRRDRSEALLVPDHDEVPWLAIPRAARPAGELEEFVNNIVRDRFVLVLPDLRYATDRAEGLHEREHSQARRA